MTVNPFYFHAKSLSFEQSRHRVFGETQLQPSRETPPTLNWQQDTKKLLDWPSRANALAPSSHAPDRRRRRWTISQQVAGWHDDSPQGPWGKVHLQSRSAIAIWLQPLSQSYVTLNYYNLLRRRTLPRICHKKTEGLRLIANELIWWTCPLQRQLELHSYTRHNQILAM